MNIIFGIMILILWVAVALPLSWDPKSSVRTNLIIGLGSLILLGLIYWVPFWLIFLR